MSKNNVRNHKNQKNSRPKASIAKKVEVKRKERKFRKGIAGALIALGSAFGFATARPPVKEKGKLRK